MRKLFQVLCAAFSTLILLSSCLGSDDDDMTLYNDMAVTSFSLGTLNRYLHTTTLAGEDSIYKVSYSAANYRFHIDQLNRLIYNVDSLPYATDAAHVICTIGTKNGAATFLKSLTSDSLFMYSSTDSLDFSRERELHVFAMNGAGPRVYKVKVNVRQTAPGTMLWERQPAGTPMPAATDNVDFASIDWSQEQLDEDIALLPQTDVAIVTWPLDGTASYTLLVGYCEQASAEAMTVWRKLADGGQGRWVYMPLAEDNRYYLPSGSKYLLTYQRQSNSVLAVSTEGKIYQSRDQGITWKVNTRYTMPNGWSGTVAAATADSEGYLWLQDQGGTVWRGLLIE